MPYNPRTIGNSELLREAVGEIATQSTKGKLRSFISKHGGIGGLSNKTADTVFKALYYGGLMSTGADILTHPEEEGGMKGALTRAAAGWGPWLGLSALGKASPKLLASAALKTGAKATALRGLGTAAGVLGGPWGMAGMMVLPTLGSFDYGKLAGNKGEKEVAADDYMSQFARLSPYQKSLVRKEMYRRKMAAAHEQRMQLLDNYDYSEFEES